MFAQLQAESKKHGLEVTARFHGVDWKPAFDTITRMLHVETGESARDYQFTIFVHDSDKNWKPYSLTRQFIITEQEKFEGFVDDVVKRTVEAVEKGIEKANNDKTTTRSSAA